MSLIIELPIQWLSFPPDYKVLQLLICLLAEDFDFSACYESMPRAEKVHCLHYLDVDLNVQIKKISNTIFVLANC